MKMKNPIHPGRLLKSELEELGHSVAGAAEALGVTRQHLYNVINGKSMVTPEMALRLERGIGSTADTWLALQAAHDLAQARGQIGRLSIKRLVAKAA